MALLKSPLMKHKYLLRSVKTLRKILSLSWEFFSILLRTSTVLIYLNKNFWTEIFFYICLLVDRNIESWTRIFREAWKVEAILQTFGLSFLLRVMYLKDMSEKWNNKDPSRLGFYSLVTLEKNMLYYSLFGWLQFYLKIFLLFCCI